MASQKIEGRILKVDSEIFIHINPGDRLVPVRVSTQLDQLALQRLESGDFVTGQGRLTAKIAHFENLYFVGVQRLLGLWRSKNWEVFEFRNYQDLRLYWPLSRGVSNRHPPDIRVKSYTYNLSPSRVADWEMLLVDFDSVELARLKLENRILYVTLLDRQTGQIKSKFELTQIAIDGASR